MKPLVRRFEKQRLAARVRRSNRRRTAAHAKKATGDPDPPPKRKNPPGGKPAGTLENTQLTNSNAAENNASGAATQVAIRHGGPR
jgi:hypothetical protein